MKKKIIISIIWILLVSILTIILISKNNKKYIMYDGIMLAMTLTDTNGNSTIIKEFPSRTNYRVEVDCGDNGIGRWLPEKWELAVEDIKGNVKCNVDFYAWTDSDKLSNIIQSNVITDENGYRYSGENPNNYIWFNNELWRIIGLVPTCTEASSGTCSATTNLVKIIRNDSIGGLAYDAKESEETGLWGSNTLYTLLNNYYYGKENGTDTDYCYVNQSIAKAICDYTSIGISDNSTDYYGKMVKSVYWNIGVSDFATPGEVYATESAKVTTNQAHIGLMSVSDYGYAAALSEYSTSLSSYNTASITGVNWLYGLGEEWTNVQYSGVTRKAFIVFNQGSAHVEFASSGCAVRPVLYLDAGVYKISGSGTMADPYMIGM